ncbi:hypothetical protein [Sphingopyxis sp.]|uniref:hypothetical protein n=1 Tax=Sphingopyxis sp. TaxID=1908224 RepID=UPI002FCB956F
MSAKSDALEQAVTDYIQARTAFDAAPGARGRALVDRKFARLAALAAPRIRYFTRTYGLADVSDDAAQVCAIALHRAADRYDPARALHHPCQLAAARRAAGAASPPPWRLALRRAPPCHRNAVARCVGGRGR